MKLKSLILTICLSLFALSGLLAQDKYEQYEYAVVEYASVAKISVTTNSGVKETTYSKGQTAEVELVKKIEEMSKEGWEVYNVNHQGPTISPSIYYLRKKKN
ncbi:MAG TPA: hypothetical protein VK154_09990 [Chitinophagales bacterium]|nr:hypothetical protein [Chitinophagales bacterium]